MPCVSITVLYKYKLICTPNLWELITSTANGSVRMKMEPVNSGKAKCVPFPSDND